MMASAKACGASCGRLCPTPPPTTRCSYLPVNLLAYAVASGCGAPLGSPPGGGGGRGEGRKGAAPPLQVVVLRFTCAQAEPPPVIVDHDRDVIRVVEGGRAAGERRVVEIPFRRGEPPDELAELAPVRLIPGPAAVGGEVELVPPGEFGRMGQGRLAG